MAAPHGVAMTPGRFALTFLNPGADLFVVVQITLSCGRKAGLVLTRISKSSATVPNKAVPASV